MLLIGKRVGVVFWVVTIGAWVGWAAQPPNDVAAPPQEEQADVEVAPPGDGRSIPWAAGLQAERAAEETIREALKQPFSDKFRDEPLRSVIRMFGRVAGVNVHIDHPALAENGLSPEYLVSDEFDQVPIGVALNWVLRPIGLTWMIENEVLLITTEQRAKEALRTRVLPVSDALLKAESPRSDERHPMSEFTKYGGLYWYGDGIYWIAGAVQEFTPGPWENEVGHGGTLSHAGHTLIVRQTDRNLVEIAQLLQVLEAAIEGTLNGGSQAVRPPYYPWKSETKVYEALKKPVTINVTGKPLNEFLADLGERFGITTRLKVRALEEHGIAPDEPISLSIDGVSLRSALRLALRPFDCVAFVDEGALKVTTHADAEKQLFTVVYDVRDLEKADLDVSELVDSIEQETPGPWEASDGTGGELAIPRAGILIIRQNEQNHAAAKWILEGLREQQKRRQAEATATEKNDAQDDGELIVKPYVIGTPEQTADLLETIPVFVHPESWTDETILRKVGTALVIRQTRKVHKDIEEFLTSVGIPLWVQHPNHGLGTGPDFGTPGSEGAAPLHPAGSGFFSRPKHVPVRE